MQEIRIAYLNALDVKALALADAEIVAAVERAPAARGRGETVIEPRVHPVPESTDETILLWHRGLATGDIALGRAMLEQAAGTGIGQKPRFA